MKLETQQQEERLRPDQYLERNLQQVKEANQRDRDLLLSVQGRRYRGLYMEYRAVYPHVAQGLAPQLTDDAWGEHGYSLLLEMVYGEGSSANGHAKL